MLTALGNVDSKLLSNIDSMFLWAIQSVESDVRLRRLYHSEVDDQTNGLPPHALLMLPIGKGIFYQSGCALQNTSVGNATAVRI